MRLWLDHTGLRSALRCLQGEGTGIADSRGLLQFGNQLIFGSELLINDFEAQDLRGKVREAIEILEELGVGPDVLRPVEYDVRGYRAACAETVQYVLPDFEFAFSSQPGVVSTPILEPGANSDLHDLIRGTLAREEVQRELAGSWPRKAGDATLWMLAASEDLFGAVRAKTQLTSAWSPGSTDQLDAFLRSHLHHVLAVREGGLYAPAAERSDMIRGVNGFLLRQVHDLVDSTVAEVLRGRDIGIPGVFAALLERSRGDPRGVIKEAVEFRSRAGPLRAWLTSVARNWNPAGGRGRQLLASEFRDLKHQLRRDLRLRRSDTTLGERLLTYAPFAGWPDRFRAGAELVDWLGRLVGNHRVSVLSAVVSDAAYGETTWAMERLTKACGPCS